MFQSFYECIEPTAKNMQSMYYQASGTFSLSGRKKCMLLIDELFLFMCRLRAGLLEQNNYMEVSGSATINNVAHPKHPEEEEK